MKWNRIVLVVLLAFTSGILGSMVFELFRDKDKQFIIGQKGDNFPVLAIGRPLGEYVDAPVNSDFVKASDISRPAVVFIKSITEGSDQSYYFRDLFFDFFSDRGPSVQSGSGVIVSQDGYIVTNHHVVKNVNKVEVVVNNRKKKLQGHNYWR